MSLKFLSGQGIDGNVGIGTNTPTSTLTVSSDAAGDSSWDKSGILIENTSTTTGEPTLAFRNAGTGGTGANYWFTGLNQSNIYKIAYGTSFTDGNTKFELSTGGVLRLNSYTQGFLQTDANGNVGLSGGGTLPGGPYLPLSAGSSYPLTGNLFIEGASTPTITITDTTNNLEGRIRVANNYMYIEADNSDAVVSTRIVLKTDGVAALYLDGNQDAIFPNGNVGIGIASPTKTLNVEFDSSSVAVNTGEGLGGGTAGTGVLLRNSNTTVGTFANLDFRANNVDARIAVTHNATNNGDFHFILDNTTETPLTRLFIEGETGNVGIGTSNPDTKLSISDTLGISGTGNDTYGQVDLVNTQTGASGDGIGPFITFRGKRGGVDSVVAAYGAIGGVNTGTTGSSTGAITFLTKNTAGAAEDLVEQMRISTGGNVGIGTPSPTSLLEVSQNLSAASTIDYPYTISSRDDGNLINQLGGEGVGIKFRIAGNAATTPGDSLVGASIAAIREMATDTDSSTGLGFFVTQNDETLDEALRIDHDRNANFLSNVNITNSLDVTDTIDIGTQTWKGYTNTPAKLNIEVAGGRAINIYNTEEDAAYLSFIDSQSDDGQYANLSFNSSGTNAFIINNMGYETTISNVGAWTFTEAVSGITPTADANFVTKAYADGLTPGAGVFLPLAGGVMTGPVDFNGTSGDHGEFEWTSGDGTTGDVWSLGFYQNSSSQASIEFYTATEALANGNISFKTGGTTNTLVLNADQDASFKGNIAVGNVALGTDTLTPMSSITLPGNAKLFGYANSIYSISNAYYDGGWKYLTTNSAAVLNIGTNGASALTLRQAASGTADDAITFTTSFEIDSSGDATFSGTVDAPTFEGNLTGNVTGNLTGVVNSTSSLADGVIGATQADGDDSTLIATTAFVQNLIETIPAGLVFQGTWDARTAAEGGATGDEGSPALVSGVGTTGHFYIVSNSGSVDLDGITDWVTGDWAVFVEVGATDSWQKIDNSSVLDGSGTGQTLPLWSGSGTSNTLTNSVVTQDSTNIGIGVAIPLHKLDIESDDNSLIKIRNTTNGGGASIEFNDNNGSTDVQNGQITYYHSDGASQGGGSSYWFTGENDQTLVLANNGRVVVQKTGSVSEVGYGFYDDVDTGMYRVGANHLGFATNGVSRLDISTTVATFGVSVKTPIGSAATPGLMIGDNDSGFYDDGANIISATLGGVKSATFHPGGRFQAVSSIQAGDDTNTAGASRVGAMRYRTTTDEPVPVTGIELITNGDFATDTDWSKGTGWAIGGGTANGTSTVEPLYQTISGFTAGNKYRVRFEVTAVTSGYIRVYCYVGASATFTNIFSTTSLTTGTYEGVFEFGGTNKILRFYGSVASTGGFTGSIDNISVVEVTEEDASYADMCMQTGASTYEWVNIVRNTY